MAFLEITGTHAGDARSSRNADRHGRRITADESPEEYLQLRDEYIARFRLRDQVEIDEMERMVHAIWSLRHLYKIRPTTALNNLCKQHLFQFFARSETSQSA